MMNSTDIKKVVKNILKHEKGLRDVQIMHPAREWHIGVLIAFLIILSSILWSSYKYVENKKADLVETEIADVDAVVYRESLVQQALEEFSKRREIRETIINTVDTAPVVVESQASTTDNNESTESVELVPDDVSPSAQDTDVPITSS